MTKKKKKRKKPSTRTYKTPKEPGTYPKGLKGVKLYGINLNYDWGDDGKPSTAHEG